MPRSTINGTAIDLDGKEMILDADQDTTLTVDTDDQIDIKVAGSDKVHITSTGLGVGITSPTQAIEAAGNIFINSSANPFLEVKTSGAGNNPFVRIKADTNYWDLQTLFSNTNDELDFRYNGTSTMMIDKNGAVTKPLQPSFHAYPSSSTNYTSADDVIIFGSTYHNIGSDYNTSTGKFTAPIAGNYLFAWAVYRGDGDDSASIHLLHNTTKKYEGRIDSSGAGGYATIAGSLVIALSASDTVHLQVRYPTIHVNSPWSYFSGTLLS